MIHINPELLAICATRLATMDDLTTKLIRKQPGERDQFIDDNAKNTWQHPEVLEALRAIVGNKCWYSEVSLTGSDPNVDHFRPKGRITEVDADLKNTGLKSDGYWWLAFEPLNYRLASMHSNQRRTDQDTAGGKWDYFPVRGARAPQETIWEAIIEDVLALDPCLATDVGLLWFDPDGNPCAVDRSRRKADVGNIERVKVTIWLYHLNKKELQAERTGHVQSIKKDLKNAHGDYVLWSKDPNNPNLQARRSFNQKIAKIKDAISDKALFASAKRCAVHTASATYPWILEFGIV